MQYFYKIKFEGLRLHTYENLRYTIFKLYILSRFSYALKRFMSEKRNPKLLLINEYFEVTFKI